MVTAVTNPPVTSASPTTALTGTSAGNAAVSDSTQAQDRFLKLLVAQLNNQDPMNPMDNAQMTSQMAQINTVTGIQQLNDTMKSMNTQFNALQLMQGSSLVGREVLTAGNQLARSGDTGRGSFDLAGPASSVKAEILTPGGQVVGSVDLGPLQAGRNSFDWNAQGYSASTNLNFRIVAKNAAQAVDAKTLMRDTVSSVGMDSAGAVALQLSRGSSVSPSAVASVL